MSTTVSAKIPKDLRERLRERQVDISVVVRNALEKEVTRLEEEELGSKLETLKKELSRKITTKDIVKTVRSSREER
jgi:hypothetical protein